MVWLYVGRTLSGLMAGSSPIAQAAVADMSTAKNKAHNMGLMTLALSVGIIVGPLIGGITSDHTLANIFNYTTPFIISAILSFICFIWLYALYKPPFTAPLSKKKISILRPIILFAEAFANRKVRKIALCFLLMQIGFSIYFQYVLVYLQATYHYSSGEIGLFNGVVGCGFVVANTLALKYLLKKMSAHKIALLGFVAVGVGQIIAASVHFQYLDWTLAFFIGLFNMVAYTAILTLFSDSVDASRQGWVMGISGAVMAIAWTLTGWAASLIAVIGTTGLIAAGGVALLFAAAMLAA